MTQEVLNRTVGPFSATMLGVGAMVGAGVFLLSGIAAGYAGPAVVLAFALNGVIALAVGGCYAELSAAMPRAGGSYFWVRQGIGAKAGFFTGWISLYANIVASALYAIGFGTFTVALLERLDIGSPVGDIELAVLITVFVTGLQYRGIGDTRYVENAITLLKIALLLSLVTGGFWIVYQRAEPLVEFRDFAPHGWTGVLMAMAIIFVSFQGFEVITRSGEEMYRPERNLPLAIFSCIVISVMLYILISAVLIAVVKGPGGVPAADYLGSLQELGMATAAEQLLPGGDVVFYIAGMASTASALIAATFSAVRVAFALGRTGDLPDFFAEVRHQSPRNAALVCGLLILVLVFSLPITEVAGAASQMFALLFAIVCLVAWRLRHTQPDLYRPFRLSFLPVCAVTGALAGIAVISALTQISLTGWILSVVWLIAGAGLLWFRLGFKFT